MSRDVLGRTARSILDAHPFAGRKVRPLLELLERCDRRVMEPGAVLCREGDPGHELFFLLKGKVTVLRRDTGGKDRALFNIDAPALIGHMSLVDGSPRGATCKIRGRAHVAVMSQPLYDEVMAAPDMQGTVMRRLIISSLSRQLGSTTELLDRMLLQLDTHPEETDEEDSFLKVAGVLDGWSVNSKGLDDVEAVESVEPSRRRRDPYTVY